MYSTIISTRIMPMEFEEAGKCSKDMADYGHLYSYRV